MGNYFSHIFFMFKAKGASVILWIGHGKVFLFSLMMSVLSGIIAICMYEIPVCDWKLSVNEILRTDTAKIRYQVSIQWDYGMKKMKKYKAIDTYEATLWTYIPEIISDSNKTTYKLQNETDSICNLMNRQHNNDYHKEIPFDSVNSIIKIEIIENVPPNTYLNRILPPGSERHDIRLTNCTPQEYSRFVSCSESKKSVNRETGDKQLEAITYVAILTDGINNPIDLPSLECWIHPEIYSLYDISQGYFHINLSVPNNPTLELNLGGAVDYFDISPEPDRRTMSSIIFSDPQKIKSIEKDGLWLFAKFAQLENLQIFRMFIITTILGFFVALTFSSLSKFLRFNSRRFRIEQNKIIRNKKMSIKKN